MKKKISIDLFFPNLFNLSEFLNFVTISLGIVFFIFSECQGKLINIPKDFLSIQEGINNSSDGDTILVYPGTYYESLNYLGKCVIIRSFSGPTSTIIDGDSLNSVVFFVSGEDSHAVIDGFTIQNGHSKPGPSFSGGGIVIQNGSRPIIRNNIITNCEAYPQGGGISCQNSKPFIIGNVIKKNSAQKGGGIRCSEFSEATIINNIITENSATYRGGGILCYEFSHSSILYNTIVGNYAGEFGGGIHIEFKSDPKIFNNIIVQNSASTEGGGIFNIQSEPVLLTNDVWNNINGDYVGITPDPGSISANPLFVDINPFNFHIKKNSPCIDRAKNISIFFDFDGNKRPMLLGFDIGADEFSDTLRISAESGEKNSNHFEHAIQFCNPNPFNPFVDIGLTIGFKDLVNLKVYDIQGQLIKIILDKNLEPGKYSFIWDGLNENGKPVVSGVYFLKLNSSALPVCKKILCLK